MGSNWGVIKWYWDGSYYMLSFEDTSIAFLVIEEGIIKISTRIQSIKAKAKLKVLFLGNPGATTDAQIDQHSISLNTSVHPEYPKISATRFN